MFVYIYIFSFFNYCMSKRGRSTTLDSDSSSSIDLTLPLEASHDSFFTEHSTEIYFPLPVMAPPSLVEMQLDRLGVDSDLKASILEMDPELQMETMNDLIRHHQMMNITRLTANLPSSDDRFESMFQGTDDDSDDVPADDSDDREVEYILPARRGRQNAADPQDDDISSPSISPWATLSGSVAEALYMVLHSGDRGGLTSSAIADRLNRFHSFLQLLQNSQEQMQVLHGMGIDKDIDEMTYEELLELEERMGSVSKGISEEKAKTVMAPVSLNTCQGNQCMVCLDQLICETAEEGVLGVRKLLVCNHVFHEKCILGWFKDNKTCPVCKKEVIDMPAIANSG